MPNLPEDNSPIERLEKELYTRTPHMENHPKATLGQSMDGLDVPKEWQHPTAESLMAPPTPKPKTHPALVAVLLGSFVFFIGAALYAAYTFSRGSNVVSADNVTVEIAGPSSIGAGVALPLEVIVSNSNDTSLSSVKLTVSYPDGTRQALDTSVSLPREQFDVGALSPNMTVRKKLNAIIYGEEGTTLPLVVEVEYRAKGSSAIFSKKKSFDLLLSSSPLSMTLDSFKEVTAGQEFETSIALTSNSTDILHALLLKAQYPSGFTFKNSIPSQTSGSDTWLIGDMSPGEKRVIKIRGTSAGLEGESQIFRFAIGPVSRDNEHLIQTPIVSLINTVNIKRPFISLNLSLNGDSNGKTSAPAGSVISGHITFTNNLPTRVIDAEINVVFSGPFERTSVSAQNGFYKSVENKIIWTKQNLGNLAVLNPGESGELEFQFGTLSASQLFALGQGQEIHVDVTVKGKRSSETSVPEEITSAASGLVRVSSNLTFSGRTLYSMGAFKNSGPIPPKADQITTYTVVWTLTNSLNQARDVDVSASLPQYVQWLNVTGPSSESIIYNKDTNEVHWHAGDVKAGTGFNTSPRIASFQIALQPSLTQVGSVPVLVGPTTITGVDSFSGADLRDTGDSLNTLISTDPIYQDRFERVVQ